MIFEKIYKRIINKIKYKILSDPNFSNTLNLFGNSKIHKSVKLVNCNITGNVSIGEGCKLINGVNILSNSELSVGRFTTINGPNTMLRCEFNKIIIGSFCSIARNVDFQEYNHYFDRVSSYFIHKNIINEGRKEDIWSKGDIVVGNDVWIGTQSIVLSGVKIGNGSIIAANSTVTKDVPPYAIVAGSPAKVIKYRFNEDIITQLELLRWWDWDLDRIKKSRALFESKVDSIEFLNRYL